MVIPFLPASNLIFRVGFVLAERVLYMSSMGYCMLVGAAFESVDRKLTSLTVPEWKSKKPWVAKRNLETLGLLVIVLFTAKSISVRRKF